METGEDPPDGGLSPDAKMFVLTPDSSTIQFVLEPDSLRKRVRVRFLFTEGSAKGLLGTVNEQRQGITMTVVSCLLLCGIKFALCELGRHIRDVLSLAGMVYSA